MALRQSVGELAATLLSMIRTRLELFALEASGQKSQMIRIVSLTFGVVLFATMAALVFSIGIVLYFWPSEYRYVAMFVLAGFYAILGLILFITLRRMVTHASVPFSATLEELRRDIALLERLNDPDPGSRRYAKHPESP